MAMNFTFSENDINEIGKTLQAIIEKTDESWTFRLRNTNTRQSLGFFIYNNIDLGGGDKVEIPVVIFVNREERKDFYD